MGDREYRRIESDSESKTVTKILGLLATLAIGIVVGIITNQAATFGTKADACQSALSQYTTGLMHVDMQAPVLSIPDATREQRYAATSVIHEKFTEAFARVLNTCPVGEDTQYLREESLKKWHANAMLIASQCFDQGACPEEEATRIALLGRDLTADLINQANETDEWGPLRRALHTLKHLW